MGRPGVAHARAAGPGWGGPLPAKEHIAVPAAGDASHLAEAGRPPRAAKDDRQRAAPLARR